MQILINLGENILKDIKTKTVTLSQIDEIISSIENGTQIPAEKNSCIKHYSKSACEKYCKDFAIACKNCSLKMPEGFEYQGIFTNGLTALMYMNDIGSIIYVPIPEGK